MKKIIMSLLIITGIILTGWLLKDITIQDNYASNDRFVQVYQQNGKDFFRIYCDKKTRVMYLVVDVYKGGGITVLVDAEGKPLLYGKE